MVFQVRAEPLDANAPPAAAFVVAKDYDEAILLLRKDINFSGYALPPLEMTACIVDAEPGCPSTSTPGRRTTSTRPKSQSSFADCWPSLT